MARDTHVAIPLRAGGLPIDENVAAEAAAWFTALMAGELSGEQRCRWQAWRAASPDHERAWRHLEAVSRRLRDMDPAARHALNDPALQLPERRRALRGLIVIAAAGAMAYGGSRTPFGQRVLADYRTGTGEQRHVTLADGTTLLLNTGTAVDIRFDAASREIVLLAGEIMVTTGHLKVAGQPEPGLLRVRTAEGSVVALGTQFVVRQRDGTTAVAVQTHRVRLEPRDTMQARVLEAGQQATFTPTSTSEPQPIDVASVAWTHAQIVADDMRLADFLTELSRYRSGVLRCDPSVADLRFSAVLPLRDTDRALAMLPNTLPVRVRARTRYWVVVEAAR
ncbi:FecR domain-containing protein [Chitinasiproducens palmae]|uniref:FecR family protein n=1 Tax=Chitinasiproducens palmae TaxID=1770053 RepID=A0A1H2PMD7_9BURK|nr:FecR domain-containing protein [Chitinasiproducens palmae]SDV46890.1 FecR family protein [Chitinasiproducens palmae]